MRIEASVNGKQLCTASIVGPGYLSAHLNLSDRPNEQKPGVLRVVGCETESTETQFVEWPVGEVQVGDVVQLRVLPEGQGTQPVERRSSSESPTNLFTGVAQGQELLSICATFEVQLADLLAKVKESESESEYLKFRRAVGHVAAELGERFLYPVYRNHPSLVPPELKGELL